MSWKINLLKQIKQAKKLRSINLKFAEFLTDLCEGDTKFMMVYSSARGKYTKFYFTENIGLETKRIILTKYGAQTWRNFKLNISTK